MSIILYAYTNPFTENSGTFPIRLSFVCLQLYHAKKNKNADDVQGLLLTFTKCRLPTNPNNTKSS